MIFRSTQNIFENNITILFADYIKKAFCLLFSFFATAVFLLFFAPPGMAQQAVFPGFSEPKNQHSKPDLSALPRLRFLTTVDFYPFNYLDAGDRLSGVHIDLARKICEELDLIERCQVQALPWEEMGPAMEAERGEAILAGLAITAQNREEYLFSIPYFRFPARLVTLRSSLLTEPLHSSTAGRRVGVIGQSAHRLLLRDLFPKANSVVYSRQDWMYEDLKKGKIDAVFGDGVTLSFWLSGKESDGCCTFSGGPYMASEYLGQGLAVAVSKKFPQLVEAIDFALHEIQVSGGLNEIYLRHFPTGFY